jgi:hypothetical protein
VTEQYGNNRVEADHGRLKARLRPMRGPKRPAAVIALGHAFVQSSAADATSWLSMPHLRAAWQRRSPSSLRSSELGCGSDESAPSDATSPLRLAADAHHRDGFRPSMIV